MLPVGKIRCFFSLLLSGALIPVWGFDMWSEQQYDLWIPSIDAWTEELSLPHSPSLYLALKKQLPLFGCILWYINEHYGQPTPLYYLLINWLFCFPYPCQITLVLMSPPPRISGYLYCAAQSPFSLYTFKSALYSSCWVTHRSNRGQASESRGLFPQSQHRKCSFSALKLNRNWGHVSVTRDKKTSKTVVFFS